MTRALNRRKPLAASGARMAARARSQVELSSAAMMRAAVPSGGIEHVAGVHRDERRRVAGERRGLQPAGEVGPHDAMGAEGGSRAEQRPGRALAIVRPPAQPVAL